MFFDIQRANFLKRVSAWILDMIVMVILATGIGTVVSAAVGYDAQYQKLQRLQKSYEEQYSIRLDISQEEYNALKEEDQKRFDEAYAAIDEDAELRYGYSILINKTIVILSMGLLLATALTDFAVPLYLGDGQTLGKKIFGLAVMNKDQTRISALALAIRTFLGKYTLERMLPVLIVVLIFLGSLGLYGTLALALLLTLECAVLIRSQNNLALHDLLAGTVEVDMKSQMIFESIDAKHAFAEKNM